MAPWTLWRCCQRVVGWVPVLFITFVVVWSYYAYVVELCVFTVSGKGENGKTVVYLVAFHLFFVMFVWSYWMTIFTSPASPSEEFYLSNLEKERYEKEFSQERQQDILRRAARDLPVYTTLASKDAAMKPKSHPMLLTKNQMKQEVDRLTTELQLITSQRNELQDHLTFISEDTMDKRPYHKPNPFYEKLKLEHAQVVSELRTLEVDYTETSEKFGELTKETVFYHSLHSWLLMEQTQLEKKLYMLRQEKKKLLDDWVTGSY